MQAEELLTVSAAARLFSELSGPVSATSVRVWADAGKIPSLRTSDGTRLFKRCDVERLAAERAAATVTE
jgi:DNA-binding transcriptional MerR regulator